MQIYIVAGTKNTKKTLLISKIAYNLKVLEECFPFLLYLKTQCKQQEKTHYF